MLKDREGGEGGRKKKTADRGPFSTDLQSEKKIVDEEEVRSKRREKMGKGGGGYDGFRKIVQEEPYAN